MIGVAFKRQQAPKKSAISNTSLHNDQTLEDSLYHHHHLLPTTRIHTNTHTSGVKWLKRSLSWATLWLNVKAACNLYLSRTAPSVVVQRPSRMTSVPLSAADDRAMMSADVVRLVASERNNNNEVTECFQRCRQSKKWRMRLFSDLFNLVNHNEKRLLSAAAGRKHVLCCWKGLLETTQTKGLWF